MMTTISDINAIPLSGDALVDALIAEGPSWNYLLPDVGNVLYYTFTDDGTHSSGISNITTFNNEQKSAARDALTYVASVTGIDFVETNSATQAQFAFFNANLSGANTSGLTSWESNYSYTNGEVLLSYAINADVFLDSIDFKNNLNPEQGSEGYQVLLHEIGHALGLKHPFEGDIKLPTALDNTDHTLMSYTWTGEAKVVYQEYDLAALWWIYGGDGLGGEYGVNSVNGTTLISDNVPILPVNQSLTGTALADLLIGAAGNDSFAGLNGNDTFNGGLGNDSINGGAGIDTAIYSGAAAEYQLTRSGLNWTLTTGASGEGSDLLTGVEWLQFGDGTMRHLTLAPTDFNGDGVSDVLWRNSATGANAVWKSGNSATKQTVTTLADQNWQVAGVGDFNGDGISDILWRNSATGANAVWKSGNSATKQTVTTLADQHWQVAGVGDFNGDGMSDILWRNANTGADAIWKSANSLIKQAVATNSNQDWQIVEALASGDLLRGGSGHNVLIGTLNNDVLRGGAGNDVLTGGAGRDLFRFETAPNATTNVDQIKDFDVNADQLQLENAVFLALTATGELAPALLRSGAHVTTAADANDFLLYDQSTGALYYDADGSGSAAAPIQIVTLLGQPALTAAEVAVI